MPRRPLDDAERAASLKYLERARALVDSLADRLPSEDIDEANHLIDHNEAPDGLLSISWSIVNNEVKVSRTAIQEIRDLTWQSASAEFLPPDLDEAALDGSRDIPER